MDILMRIFALVRKELRAIFLDWRSRNMVFLPVLIEGLLFPLAATLEVSNNSLAILDEDGGGETVELVQRLSHMEAFSSVMYLTGEDQIQPMLDERRVLGVVRFPSDFSRKVAAGEPAGVQFLLDGRRSNSGQIAAGYVREVLSQRFNELAAARGVAPLSELVVTHRYNPNLNYRWFILPCLTGIIVAVSALILTALSVAREREEGTFEQLLVSPFSPGMIMIGKALSALLVGLGQVTAIFGIAVLVYGVPFEGALVLLYGCVILYFMALVGFGLLISSVCRTQQQAFFGAFAFMMPGILLSGLAAPVENMPDWLQFLDQANPVRHYLPLAKGIFLKDLSTMAVLEGCLPLVLISVVTLGLAVLVFRRRFG